MLNKMLKWRKKNSKGFSLVELIIVIAIMAILVGILAPQFIKYVEKSRESTDIKNMQEVISAIQVYCADEANTVTSETNPITLTKDGLTGAGTAATKALTDAGLNAANIKAKSSKYAGQSITYTITNNVVTFTGTGALATALSLAS